MTKPTPHLKKVSKSNLPDDMKQSWDQANDLTGDATFVEVSGNNPDVYRWYLDEFYQKLFYSDRLETTLVELVRLRLANIHGCAFCNKGDTAHALKSGITQEQIDDLNKRLKSPQRIQRIRDNYLETKRLQEKLKHQRLQEKLEEEKNKIKLKKKSRKRYGK